MLFLFSGSDESTELQLLLDGRLEVGEQQLVEDLVEEFFLDCFVEVAEEGREFEAAVDGDEVLFFGQQLEDGLLHFLVEDLARELLALHVFPPAVEHADDLQLVVDDQEPQQLHSAHLGEDPAEHLAVLRLLGPGEADQQVRHAGEEGVPAYFDQCELFGDSAGGDEVGSHGVLDDFHAALDDEFSLVQFDGFSDGRCELPDEEETDPVGQCAFG